MISVTDHMRTILFYDFFGKLKIVRSVIGKFGKN